MQSKIAKNLLTLALSWLAVMGAPAADIDVAAELPPGFEIRGPDARWTCSGGADTRGSFTVLTGDSLANQAERMMPQFWDNMLGDLEQKEMDAHERDDPELLEQVRERTDSIRELMEAGMAQMEANQELLKSQMARVRRDFGARATAELVGQNDGRECHMTLGIKLKQAQGGAQIVSGDDWNVGVTPAASVQNIKDVYELIGASATGKLDDASLLQRLASMQKEMSGDADEPQWLACGESDPCDPGQVVLEHADPGHLSGTFQFQVMRDGKTPGQPPETREVSGYFNITSEHDWDSDSLLDVTDEARGNLMLRTPGAEMWRPGGSVLGSGNDADPVGAGD